MGKVGKTGVSANTTKNIIFGAGTIHKNLKYTTSAWNFADSIIGATSGGSKFVITPNIESIDADGVLVRVKGLDVKVGETAIMEVNFLEITKELIQLATLGKAGTSADANYDLIESKENISTATGGDYLENIAFVGQTLEGKNIIVILENAICTGGLDFDAKNKTSNVGTLTFESTAEMTTDMDKLPWKIYYPKASA